MSTTTTTTSSDLRTCVETAHEQALGALAGPTTDPLAAVAWCSVHLAAVDSVLHPAAVRQLPGGRKQVARLRTVDRLLQQAVCRLDRRMTGDVHLVDQPVAVFEQEARRRLEAHVEAERAVLAALVEVLEDGEQQALAERLQAATAAAPTRPHPHNRHTPLGGLVTRVDATVDRIRDLMDNRVVPTPHRPVTVLPRGRWASYLLCVPYPPREQPPG